MLITSPFVLYTRVITVGCLIAEAEGRISAYFCVSQESIPGAKLGLRQPTGTAAAHAAVSVPSEGALS